MIPTREEHPNGLHQRYHVEKIDGENDPRAVYLVLRLDHFGDDPKWLTIDGITPEVCQYTSHWAVRGEAERYLSRITGKWVLWGTHLKREDFWWPTIEDVLEFCYLKADLPDGVNIITSAGSFWVVGSAGPWWPTAREAYLAAQAAARPAEQCPLDGIDAPPLPRAEAEAIVDRIIKEAVLESRPTDAKGEGLKPAEEIRSAPRPSSSEAAVANADPAELSRSAGPFNAKLTALEAENVRLRSLLLGCRNAWVRDASEGDGIRDEDSLLLQCVDAALTPAESEAANG